MIIMYHDIIILIIIITIISQTCAKTNIQYTTYLHWS